MGSMSRGFSLAVSAGPSREPTATTRISFADDRIGRRLAEVAAHGRRQRVRLAMPLPDAVVATGAAISSASACSA